MPWIESTTRITVYQGDHHPVTMVVQVDPMAQPHCSYVNILYEVSSSTYQEKWQAINAANGIEPVTQRTPAPELSSDPCSCGHPSEWHSDYSEGYTVPLGSGDCAGERCTCQCFTPATLNHGNPANSAV